MTTSDTPAAAGQPANTTLQPKVLEALKAMLTGQPATRQQADRLVGQLFAWMAKPLRATKPEPEPNNTNAEDWRPAPFHWEWVDRKRLVFLSGEAQPIKAEAGELRFYEVHPSRTAPLCKDCQHVGVLGDRSMRFQMCDHPSAPRCAVNGTPERRAESGRNPGRPCGPTGELFEPRKNAA